MCEQQALHQRNQMLICEGRQQAAEQLVTMLEKDIALERAVVARREEVERERQEAERVSEEPTKQAPEEPTKRRRKKVS